MWCVLALVGAPVLAGCGGPGSSSSSGSSATTSVTSRAVAPRQRQRVTLILDFTPNAVHAGIYRALAAGYYRRQGIDLRVVAPSATSDTLKLIDAGSAQFGLADGSDLANLIAQGGDAQGVMAITQRPLGGLIAAASEHLHSPAQLQGKAVGITGVPSDRAVLDTEVREAGGDPGRVHVVTIGFNGAQALKAGRIAAFTGFIPDDGVQLKVSGTPITAFALDAYGGPAYPGLVAFTRRGLIASDPELVQGFVTATLHGYEDTLADPKRSLRELLAANPTLQEDETKASLKEYLGLFDASAPAASGSARANGGQGNGSVPLGAFQEANVRALSSWMVANHLIERPVEPSRYATNSFVQGAKR